MDALICIRNRTFAEWIARSSTSWFVDPRSRYIRYSTSDWSSLAVHRLPIQFFKIYSACFRIDKSSKMLTTNSTPLNPPNSERCCRRLDGGAGFGRTFKFDSTTISSKATPSNAAQHEWIDGLSSPKHNQSVPYVYLTMCYR